MGQNVGPLVTINQDTDTPARQEVTPAAVLTYLYDRSRDTKQANTSGQDFIAYRCDDQRVVFAVCDGVSQSFYGDIAARFLGEHLVNWLEGLEGVDPSTFGTSLDQILREWTADATALVQAKTFSDSVAPMVRDALDRKRQNGSESMFVAGRVDLATQTLAVCWMGDMRLWLWDNAAQPIELPGAVWETRQRWSSRIGPKNGAPNTAVMPLAHIARITIHSDGVGKYAADLHTISLDSLDQMAQALTNAPASDDISVLDIALDVPPPLPSLPAPSPYLPDPRESVFRWNTIDGAGWYRVEVTRDDRQWTNDAPSTTFFVPPDLLGAGKFAVCRVQALANGHLPGLWSEPIEIGTRPAVVAPTPLPVVAEVVPLVTAYRPFRLAPAMIGAVILAVALSIGWFLMYFQ